MSYFLVKIVSFVASKRLKHQSNFRLSAGSLIQIVISLLTEYTRLFSLLFYMYDITSTLPVLVMKTVSIQHG